LSEGPQYTSCVESENYVPLSTAIIATLSALIVVGGVAAFFTAGIGAIIAIASLVQLLRYVLDFMLNGKLICLHRSSKDCNCGVGGNTICAIGEVADTEEVGEDKNPIEDIDNDFAMNVLLAPFDLRKLALLRDPDRAHAAMTDPSLPQGDLLARQPGVPLEDGKPVFSGYFRTMVYQQTDDKYFAWTELVGRDYGWTGIFGPDQQQSYGDYLVKNAWLNPLKASIPALHCEFEGSRIRDMLDALEAFSLGGSWCKKNFFYRFVCAILQTIFAPFALIALAVAWATAKDGKASDALSGGGTISAREWVVLRGRWAYDSGHTGWNEVHATRTVQKIDKADVPVDPAHFRDYWRRWCERLSEVPQVQDPGLRPLTPAQQVVADNQAKPEHQWVLHPEVDGCAPADSEEDPPVLSPIH
jgi:hypothetical protein